MSAGLQDIYGKLEEPDGLEGLVRLRSGGPGLHDQILAAEKAGKWSEALTLYEQALHPVTGQSPAYLQLLLRNGVGQHGMQHVHEVYISFLDLHCPGILHKGACLPSRPVLPHQPIIVAFHET